MTAKENGGSAFPNQEAIEFVQMEGKPETARPTKYIWTGGMTLRDWFAGKAMQGLISTDVGWKVIIEQAKDKGIERAEVVADCAYELADALLAQREK